MAHQSTLKEPSVLSPAAQNAEQLADPDCDATTLVYLKRIIENHVAALEILKTIARADATRSTFQ